VLRAWALLALLALGIVAVAIVLARRAARRISVPFEQITSAALEMGRGRYDLGLPVWGIAEADAAGAALRESASAIDDLVSHERDFIRHASHQLRTPLTAALLHLQANPPDVTAALERTRQLETTIDDLLALRAVADGGRCRPEQVAADAVERWTTPTRPVVLRADDAGEAAVPAAALRQALDVLLDNAFRHGAGAVTITVEPYGDLVAVEVADNGAGFTPGAEYGTGLQLANGIALRAHGSMLIRRRSPHPRVALLLPRYEPGTGADLS
jgi:signal transduction histidine kinase